MTRKEQLIQDIQNLLNNYTDLNTTSINPNLLEFMDENTLVNIIDSLLEQKDSTNEPDTEWLEKFKKYN